MSTQLQELVLKAKSLPPGERAELLRELEKLTTTDVANPSPSVKEQFLQQLVKDGVLKSAERHQRDAERFHRYQPVAYEGQPLSQTIIEDRR